MINKSQKRDDRFWRKWRESGAVSMMVRGTTGSEIFLSNGNSLVHDSCDPPEGWSSLFWSEKDSSGESTGLSGEIILNEKVLPIPTKNTWEGLVLRDYNQLLRPSQNTRRERLYDIKKHNDEYYPQGTLRRVD